MLIRRRLYTQGHLTTGTPGRGRFALGNDEGARVRIYERGVEGRFGSLPKTVARGTPTHVVSPSCIGLEKHSLV